MLDIGSFFAAVLAAFANLFGIRTAAWNALQGAYAAADRTQVAFRTGLKRHLAGPIAKIMFTAMAVLVIILVGVSRAGVTESLYGPVKTAGIVVIGIVCALAMIVYALGRYLPLWSPFLLALLTTVGGMGYMAVRLHLLGFHTENAWVHALAIVASLAAIGVVSASAWLIAWLTEKVGTAIEGALELAAPLIAIAPGVTLENYRERFSGLIDVFRQESWLPRVMGVLRNATAGYLAFAALACYDISVEWAVAMGGLVLFVGIIAFGAKLVGLVKEVNEQRQRFWKVMLAVGALPIIVGGPFYRIFVAEPVREGVATKRFFASLWLERFIAGDVGIAGGFTVWTGLGATLLLGFLGYFAYAVSEKWDAGWGARAKVALRAVFGAAFVYAVIGLGVALGIWGETGKGITLRSSAVQPRLEDEQIDLVETAGFSDAPSVTLEDRIELEWYTTVPADCKVELVEVRYLDKKTDLRLLKAGMMMQAVADASRTKHTLVLNGMAQKVIVTFRIHATGTEGMQKGITTVSRDYNAGPAIPRSALAGANGAPVTPSATPSVVPDAPPKQAPPSTASTARRRDAKPPERLASVDDPDEVRRRFDELYRKHVGDD
ncbi:hypothetical protein L0Y59_01650 [Candidatus Uhrbacteria bacterium]|nr:hypothetical protein [Candidatus Uhrbacteria bacterium]